MNPVKVTLSRPLDIDGQKVTELSFRESEVGDMLDAEDATTEYRRLVIVLAAMCNVPVERFRKIATRDFYTIMDRCKDLVGNGTSATTGAA